MNRRTLVILGVVALAFAAVAFLLVPVAPPQSATTQPAVSSNELPTLGRPNILLISLDTVRPDRLVPAVTPNLDKLASGSRGVRFADARAQAPWTLPSHMSLFTSMLPSHNRVETINQILPEQFATLPEILHAHGYATAAIVNNGQMRAHWGFARGFDVWRELEVDTPAGDCESITAQAIRWLDLASRDKPFLLFLHYYDAHDPYDPPAEFRERFGVKLSGEAARELAWRGRSPVEQLSPEQVTQLKNAYDGELAWIDRELGKLFAQIPPDTLVVLFSDHGEAFEEHGWTLHGATLFDEEVRAVLVLNHPKLPPTPTTVSAPVALLDVAPTILGLCGIQPPPHFSGTDLRPLIAGQAHDPSRVILSETKAVLEGYVLKSAALPPWKAVRDLIDGSTRVYKLPDESVDVSTTEPAITAALSKVLDAWAAEDDHWVIHAEGSGEFEITLSSAGQFLVFVPAGIEPSREGLEVSEDGKTLRWTVYPAGPRRKSLYVQMSPADAQVHAELKVDGQSRPATQPSLRIVRHAGAGAGVAARPGKLDEHTLRQLRSLGYVR